MSSTCSGVTVFCKLLLLPIKVWTSEALPRSLPLLCGAVCLARCLVEQGSSSSRGKYVFLSSFGVRRRTLSPVRSRAGPPQPRHIPARWGSANKRRLMFNVSDGCNWTDSTLWQVVFRHVHLWGVYKFNYFGIFLLLKSYFALFQYSMRVWYWYWWLFLFLEQKSLLKSQRDSLAYIRWQFGKNHRENFLLSG